MKTNIFLWAASVGMLTLTLGCVPNSNLTNTELPATAETTSQPVTSPSPNPEKTPAPTATPSPDMATSPTTTSPENSNTVSAEAWAQVNRIELQYPYRFLDAKGQTLQLQVRFLDTEGTLLNLNNVPVQYQSSRPDDFSVSETGLLTALVDYGFSDIQVTLGNKFTQQIFSVNAGGGSGGSSTTTAAPTQEDIQGTVAFQF